MNRLSPTLLLFIFSLSTLTLSGCTSQPPPPLDHQHLIIQIPHMTQTPTFDGRMGESEWNETVQINGTFTIADGSKAEGAYPFRLWLGATNNGLLLAAEVHNKTPNPFSTDNERWADALYLFFKTDEGSNLTKPSFMLAGFTEGASTWTNRGFWDGKEWERDPHSIGSTMDDEYHPINGTWVRAGPGEGTTIFEVYTDRIPAHSIRNSLHLTPGAEFRMGLAYMRGAGPGEEWLSPDARGRFLWPHDAYPGEGYSPHGMYHPEDWLRFRMP